MGKEVKCSFGRWSMKFNNDGILIIKFSEFPISGQIMVDHCSTIQLKETSNVSLKEYEKRNAE